METETFSVLVENRFGVLTRVAGLFSGRGYNIDSLTVSPTRNPDYSRMTIVTHGDDAILEQIEKQLNKLIEVVNVTRLTSGGFVARELMLIKLSCTPTSRPELLQIAASYDAKVVDIQSDSTMIQITDLSSRIDEFLILLNSFGIIEIARTGMVALARSSRRTE